MGIWETDVAILGSDGELELQAAGWEPVSVMYIPVTDDPNNEGYMEVFYRRKREGLREELL